MQWLHSNIDYNSFVIITFKSTFKIHSQWLHLNILLPFIHNKYIQVYFYNSFAMITSKWLILMLWMYEKPPQKSGRWKTESLIFLSAICTYTLYFTSRQLWWQWRQYFQHPFLSSNFVFCFSNPNPDRNSIKVRIRSPGDFIAYDCYCYECGPGKLFLSLRLTFWCF